MSNILHTIHQRFADALTAAFGPEYAVVDPILRASGNPKFGDFQANLAMAMGKQLGKQPRQVAQAIVDQLHVDDLCEPPTVAGPGFINLTLREATLAAQLHAIAGDDRLGLETSEQPCIVVVDYSSPNVAKEMHIGHLRSTIIGDCIARVLEFCGEKVIRQNHLGDWGTQFGMLIEHLAEMKADTGEDDAGDLAVTDLDSFYREAKARFDADADFADRARQRVVALQAHEEKTLAHWRRLVEASTAYFQKAYDQLHVKLTPEDIRGESSYNDMLADVVKDLDAAGALRESDGARVVYPTGFADKEGNPLGMIVQKRDGGYLYATTDLAAARHRITNLGAARIIYVTDARQAQHFAMVFTALREVGWAPESVSLEHVPFGMILGQDRKPFKTREGGTVKLADVIAEAIDRADAVIAAKNHELPETDRREAAAAIGIGAVKYADLSNDRIKDYVFDWERMLAFEGNTAPYLINAYVRIQSIFRKGEVDPASLPADAIAIQDPAEKQLALQLMQFSQSVHSVAASLEPHRLCTYLYDLATLYHKFYENCPVLKAPDASAKASRLALSNLTARTLAQGLDLLGIPTVERM